MEGSIVVTASDGVSPKKQSGIDIELGEMENVLVSLEKEIERFEQSLSPVLRPESPAKDLVGEKDETNLPPITNRIRTYRKGIARNVRILREITDRLDI